MNSNQMNPRSGMVRRAWLAAGFSLTLSMTGIAAQASTYYVASTGSDSNAGTIAKPFATLSSASQKMVPGDVLYVRAGTYKMSAHQTVQANGSASKWVTISNYPGESPVFDASGLPANTDAISLQGQYLNLSGLEIKNSPKDDLTVWGGQNMSISNCVLHDCQQSGLLAMYTTPYTVQNLTVQNCTIYNCCLCNSPAVRTATTVWSPALYIQIAKNVVISNNTIYDNFGEGVGMNHCYTSTVSNNTIYDNFSVEAYLDNGVQTSIVNNLIYSTLNPTYFRNGSPATGLQCGIESSSYTGPIGLVSDTWTGNCVINCSFGFYYGNYGLAGGMKNCVVQNNTFYSGTQGLLFLDPDAGHSGNTVSNNIWCQTQNRSMLYNGATSGFTFGKNCWYGGLTGAKTYAGLGDINANPMFYSPGAYNTLGYNLLPSSPCISGKMGMSTQTGSVAP